MLLLYNAAVAKKLAANRSVTARPVVVAPCTLELPLLMIGVELGLMGAGAGAIGAGAGLVSGAGTTVVGTGAGAGAGAGLVPGGGTLQVSG